MHIQLYEMHQVSVVSTVEKLEVLRLLCIKNWVVFSNLYPVTHIYVMGYSSRSACPCVCSYPEFKCSNSYY